GVERGPRRRRAAQSRPDRKGAREKLRLASAQFPLRSQDAGRLAPESRRRRDDRERALSAALCESSGRLHALHSVLPGASGGSAESRAGHVARGFLRRDPDPARNSRGAEAGPPGLRRQGQRPGREIRCARSARDDGLAVISVAEIWAALNRTTPKASN